MIKYGVWFIHTYSEDFNGWIRKGESCPRGFDDNGKFATYDINEAFITLEKAIAKYDSYSFEVREKE